MTKEEAKLLLCVCRPCGADDEEPIMKEARECLHSDADAQHEVYAARELDSSLSEKLCCVCVPACLKTEILAGARLGKCERGFIRCYGRAMAAVAAVLLVLGTVMWKGEQSSETNGETVTLSTFRDEAASLWRELSEKPLGYLPAYLPHDRGSAERYFTANQTRPGELPDQGIVACRVVEWRGNKVAICCMKKMDQEAHLFVIPSSAVEGGDSEIEKAIVQKAGLPVTVWREGDTVRALVGGHPGTQLEPFLVAKL
jgi:hypothetical protein